MSLPPAAQAASLAAVESAILQASPPVLPPAVAPDSDDEEESAPVPMPGEENRDSLPPGLITVFSNPSEFNVKHPLHSTWQLWFDSASKQDKAKSWDDALVKVIAFDSVEEFWGLYNNIVPPSLIHPNSNYYLFKQGVKPAWEDPANSKGGKWSVQLPRGKYSDTIDNYWLYTMLAAIGETFEIPFTPAVDADAPETTPAPAADLISPLGETNEITGVIVSARKAFYRLNIWTRSSTPEAKAQVENIGRHFKYGVLGLEQGLKISDRDKVSSDVEFVSHKDSQAKYGTKVTKWTV